MRVHTVMSSISIMQNRPTAARNVKRSHRHVLLNASAALNRSFQKAVSRYGGYLAGRYCRAPLRCCFRNRAEGKKVTTSIWMETISNVQSIMVSVFSDSLNCRYNASYDREICIGELIRNLCVNLNIDPDTNNGITDNISVARKMSTGDFIHWDYNPFCSITTILTTDEKAAGVLALRFDHDWWCPKHSISCRL